MITYIPAEESGTCDRCVQEVAIIGIVSATNFL